MTFYELESSRRSIEIPPQGESASGGDDIKHQRNQPVIPVGPYTHGHRAEQWNQNNRRD
jgi:hypothetical protein